MQKSITIFRQNCFVSQYRKTSQGNPLVFQKNSVNKNFYVSEGYVTNFDFLSKFFCLTMLKRFAGEPFCAVFQKISVGKNFMDKRGGGKYQDFPSKIFCLAVPKTFVGESFTVALISGIEKLWIGGGGEDQDFPSKFFVSQSRITS